MVVARRAIVVVRDMLPCLVVRGKEKKEMKLRDVTKIIVGDFYITLPRLGVIRDDDRWYKMKCHIFNAEAIDKGLDTLPEYYLDRQVLIHPWDYETLVVEVLENVE